MPQAADQEPRPPKPLGIGTICFVVSTLSTIAVTYAVENVKLYGYSLFLGVPFVVGLLLALLYQYDREWKWPEVLLLTLLNLAMSALWLLLCKIEGVVCILMAAVLVAGITLAGILFVWFLRRVVFGPRRTQLNCLAVVSIPLAMNWEATHRPTPPMLEQTTTIEVNASPDIVWQFIPSFPPITDPPAGWLASGVAYPIASEIDGNGLGATRRCIVSTGTMPEVVTAWAPGKKLEFEVKDTPPAMVETNPFGEVHAAHLEGYVQARYGRFVLVPLPDGRTRIEGTSWFEHDLWPQWYWEPVTRHTVSQIHTRVLKHIKALAEKAATSAK
ncbi:MAG: SRPBCC family protein [Prosthecobacter sp.]|nr:SRPBCC family protein [Prosthecobacter sp.]